MRKNFSLRRMAPLLILLALIATIVAFCLPQDDERPEEQDFVALGGPEITIITADGTKSPVALDDFLIQVVAAEMPASFDEDALRAQAVAARSYIMRCTPPYGATRHEGASVCCDSTHCQAWISEEKMKENWGEDFTTNYARIYAAVRDTAGMVLMYQDEVAQTPYCSTCGGYCEDAAACWSSSCDYLIAHKCIYCASSPKLASAESFSLAEAAGSLGVAVTDLQNMCVESFTPGGRVAYLSVGEKRLKGTEVRSLLGLSSAAFSWVILGDNIAFTSLGFGHGVGMCQYGADGMGEAGFGFNEILASYYPGTELKELY